MKLLFLCLFLMTITGIGKASEITIVTERFPPFQITDGDKITGGFSTEVVNALLEETGIKAKMQVFPWARAYKMALTQKNVLIFSITRNEEREDFFNWVGSIFALEDYFWSLNHELEIRSLEDAKKYTIAVPRDDNQHQFLVKNGFTKLYPVTDLDTALKMLYAGRIDLVMGNDISTTYRLKSLNFEPSKLKKIYKIGQQWGDLSIAFSKNTSDQLVERFQIALEKIKSSGQFEKILNRWIIDQHLN